MKIGHFNEKKNYWIPDVERLDYEKESWLESFVGMVATIFFIGTLFLIAIVLQ